MKNSKKQHSANFKAKVALEAIMQTRTIAEISSIYKVHPTQINRWKNQLKENLSTIFSDKRKKEDKDKEQLIEELYRQIGQQKVEIDWMKKKVGFSF